MVMTFMVTQGFSLLELRKLYIDELVEYYQQTILILEKRGELKEGSYNKLKDNGEDAKVVVNQLRKSLMGLNSKKKK